MNICKKQMTKKYMRLFRQVDVWHGYLGVGLLPARPSSRDACRTPT
jgi:hypothetical protein